MTVDGTGEGMTKRDSRGAEKVWGVGFRGTPPTKSLPCGTAAASRIVQQMLTIDPADQC